MRKLNYLVSAILTAILCFSGNLLAYSGDGDGTTENPYQISTVEDWQELMATPDDWSSSFILMADVNLSGVTVTSVGNYGFPFYGVFDGNDNIISNAVINQPVSDYVGLFGYVGSDGQIFNLGVKDVNIIGRYVGGLVGVNSGTLTSCYATGSVSGTNNFVGGLVGQNYYGTITSCYATGSVTGTTSVGGLVGSNFYGTLTSCYATSSVSGINYYVGGLVGSTLNGSITSCYATGSVTGTTSVGGLVGCNNSTGSITVCYAAGSVSGTGNFVGGLVGENRSGTITNCLWDIQTSGKTTSAGGTGLTTAAMYGVESYLHYFWDFKSEIANGTMDIWAMPAGGGYPVLAWQLGDSPVSNDEMSQAVSVTAVSSVSGSSIGATGLDITRNSYNDSVDVWYYFDCTETDKYTITVEPTGFNSTLGVFDAAQREVVFNDDFFGEKSVVVLNATAGRRYYIRVAGYDGQTGDFTLTIAQGAIQAIQGDVNYDGIVNLIDFAIFASHWLEGI